MKIEADWQAGKIRFMYRKNQNFGKPVHISGSALLSDFARSANMSTYRKNKNFENQ